MTAPGSLNWRDRRHWGGGTRLPCAHCGRGAFLRDDDGRPCHKTCAEAATAPTENTPTMPRTANRRSVA